MSILKLKFSILLMISLISRGFRSSQRLLVAKDYYKTLGVISKASEAEIKKAYFSLAKQWHPDVNKSPDAKNKFAEINQAYETLSDPEKRKTYDNTGMTGDEQEQAKSSGYGPYSSSSRSAGYNPFESRGAGSNPFGGRRPKDYASFEDVFDEFDNIFNMNKKEKKSFKGDDIVLTIEVSFMEAALGCKKQVNYEQRATCEACLGKKSKPGTNPMKCLNCGGRGVVFLQKGPISMSVTCTRCRGGGLIIKDPCLTCSATGISHQRKTEILNIPSGVNNGQNLRMANKGHNSEGDGPPGDLLIKVNVSEHPVFKREGFDVISEVSISPAQAALGATINVETLQGNTKVTIESGTAPGSKKRIPRKGIASQPHQTAEGDHIVIIKLSIPKSLTPKQRELYKQLAEEEGSQVEQNSGFFSKLKNLYKN